MEIVLASHGWSEDDDNLHCGIPCILWFFWLKTIFYVKFKDKLILFTGKVRQKWIVQIDAQYLKLSQRLGRNFCQFGQIFHYLSIRQKSKQRIQDTVIWLIGQDNIDKLSSRLHSILPFFGVKGAIAADESSME